MVKIVTLVQFHIIPGGFSIKGCDNSYVITMGINVKEICRSIVKKPFESLMVLASSIIALGVPSLAYAGSKYNVVKNGSFEEDSVWEEYESNQRADANRHYLKGYESDYCGFANTTKTGIQTKTLAELKQGQDQGFSPRKIAEIDSINWYHNYVPQTSTGIANFGVIVSSEQKDTLAYQYGRYGGRNDTTHYKVIYLDANQDSTWNHESRLFGGQNGDWATEGLPSDATINEVSFYSIGYKGSDIGNQWQSQTVKWDSVALLSSRFDHDVGPVTINYVQNTPVAAVRNSGAFSESFPTECDIYSGGNKVYSDIVSTTGLQSDSTQPINFKPFSGGQADSMVVYTQLAEDQNTANDTMSRKITGIAEAVERAASELQAWPALTRGQVNYISSTPVTVYNIVGSKVSELPKGKGSFTLKADGVYFVEGNGKAKKIVRVE
jgi:hypothetical protein